MTTIEFNGLTLGHGTNYSIYELSGIDAPPIRSSEQNNTDEHGGNIFSQKFGMRTIAIEGLVKGATSEIYFNAKRALASAFTISSGPLVFNLWDGSSKSVNAKIVQPPLIVEKAGEIGIGRFSIILRAEDPFFVGDLITETIGITEYGGTEIPTEVPMSLSGGSIDTAIINNTGDVESTPLLVITGPTVNPVVTNQTTGKSFSIDTTIGSGQEITIENDTSGFRVVDGNGTSYLRYFTGELFALALGNNSIIFTDTGGSATATLRIDFYPKSLSY